MAPIIIIIVGWMEGWMDRQDVIGVGRSENSRLRRRREGKEKRERDAPRQERE